jgi:hypothetical protein
MAVTANPATIFKQPNIVDTRSSAFVTLSYENTQSAGENMTYTFYVPPQEIEINTPSRVTVYQNISGNTFVDNLGAGTTLISFNGTTGFMYNKSGQSVNNRGAGHLSYQLLKYICQIYHEACKKGQTAFAKLTLNISLPDAPEFGQWKVTIKDFIVKRSVSEPLLFRYQINFICLSEDTFSATYSTPSPTNVGINSPKITVDAAAAKSAAEIAHKEHYGEYTIPPKSTETLIKQINSFFVGDTAVIDGKSGILIKNIQTDIFKINANYSATYPQTNEIILTLAYDNNNRQTFQKTSVSDDYINTVTRMIENTNKSPDQLKKLNRITNIVKYSGSIQSELGTTLFLATTSSISSSGSIYAATIPTSISSGNSPRTLETIADKYVLAAQLTATGNGTLSKVAYLKTLNSHITCADTAELSEGTVVYYPVFAGEP